MVNKETGMAIGNEVGKIHGHGSKGDGTTIRSFLWIKTLLDVNKPLRRGVMLMMEEEKSLWCPLMYEFLPEFCYTCGIKGHTDKVLTSSYQWGRSNLLARNYVSS
jgi:hypothetical protein